MSEKERTSVILHSRILKELRQRQAKHISETEEPMSLSRQINEDLAKYYKIKNFEYVR